MLYLVRRRLGFSIPEWEALPWWQARLYLEGLAREAEQAAGDQPQRHARWETASEDDLAGLGVQFTRGVAHGSEAGVS